jgi:hypothetical protein
MEWEPANEEDGRADAAGQVSQPADRLARPPMPPDAPKLSPKSDAELKLPSKEAAGQCNESGSPAASLVPEKDPAQDEHDGVEWEPLEEEPEDVEWEPMEEEPQDVEWEPTEEEPVDVEWDPQDDEVDDS